MLRYQDFAPKMTKAPGFIAPAEHESFEAALEDANRWISEHHIRVINIETVVLPNIWSRYEEGPADTALGTGDSVNYWHQFLRVWYEV